MQDGHVMVKLMLVPVDLWCAAVCQLRQPLRRHVVRPDQVPLQADELTGENAAARAARRPCGGGG